jgi:hypothetical protein
MDSSAISTTSCSGWLRPDGCVERARPEIRAGQDHREPQVLCLGTCARPRKQEVMSEERRRFKT